MIGIIFVDNELNYIIENKNIPETFSRFLNGFLPYPRHTDSFKASYPLYTTEEFQSLYFLKSIRLPGCLNTFGSLRFEDALRQASLFSLN